MQGQALAVLIGLLALGLVTGCGSSDTSSSSTASPTGASPAPSEAGQNPESLRRQVRELREASERREARERQSDSKPAGPAVGESQTGGEGGDPPAPEEEAVHHDSGGGAKQFRGPGDNSIQESGSEASAAERERAAAVLHGYFDSHAAGRWATACGYLSAFVVVGLERTGTMSQSDRKPEGCPQVLGALSEGLPQRVLREGAQADVGSLRINGERAFALYNGARGRGYAMPMVKEGGEWKVAALAGVPITE